MTFDYDAELRRFVPHFEAAVAAGPDDDVLDIGCGAGQTTRTAAAVARSALGVDVSPAMVERARELAGDVPNVRFEEADAQVHPFDRNHFSVAMSRFGTMFFADPQAAFTNIRRALRPGARFVQLVWQSADRQEWVREIQSALGTADDGGGAFSMADKSTVENLLTAAGFTAATMTEVAEPVWYGQDPAAAVRSVRALWMVRDHPDPEAALHETMAAHAGADGVWFDARAWLVRAVSA